MPITACADCGRTWSRRPPGVCPTCGHNVGADNHVTSDPRLAERRRLEVGYGLTRIGEGQEPEPPPEC